MKAIYIRVSSKEQNTQRQKTDTSNIYEDKISGTIPFDERPEGKRLLNHILKSKIKEVEVSSLSRLGRNMIDIIKIIDFFDEHNVNLIIKDLGISSRTEDNNKNKMFNLIGLILSSFAQMTREENLEAQSQSIRIKKEKGLKYHDTQRKRETNEEVLEKYKNALKLIKTGLSDAQILKTNIIVYDKNYYNLTEKQRKNFKGKPISRNTLKKIKHLI